MPSLEDNLISIKKAIFDAELAAGRQPAAVNLLAVSKNQPAESVAQLYELGQRDFAENYWQELQEKQRVLSHLPISWHFIGRIQSRKAKHIAQQVDWVHTVASEKVVQRLAEGRAQTKLAPLQVCVQVNISNDPGKDGVAADEVLLLCRQVQASPALKLRGLMTILKDGLSPDEQLHYYQQMMQLSERLNQAGCDLDALSMGMSADFPIAIAAGANWLRIGRALFK